MSQIESNLNTQKISHCLSRHTKTNQNRLKLFRMSHETQSKNGCYEFTFLIPHSSNIYFYYFKLCVFTVSNSSAVKRANSTKRRQRLMTDDRHRAGLPPKARKFFLFLFSFFILPQTNQQANPISSSIFQSCCNTGWILFLTRANTQRNIDTKTVFWLIEKNIISPGSVMLFCLPQSSNRRTSRNTLIFFVCFCFSFFSFQGWNTFSLSLF